MPTLPSPQRADDQLSTHLGTVMLVRSRHIPPFLSRARGPFRTLYHSWLSELHFSLTQQGPSTHRWVVYTSNKRARAPATRNSRLQDLAEAYRILKPPPAMCFLQQKGEGQPAQAEVIASATAEKCIGQSKGHISAQTPKCSQVCQRLYLDKSLAWLPFKKNLPLKWEQRNQQSTTMPL